jgi:cysteine desulfurase
MNVTMNMPVYLDYNATTPIHPEVAAFMKPFLEQYFGNPSSGYSYGVESRLAIEHSRSQLAALLGCHPSEIIFTSGGSESDNLAIKGVAFANRAKGSHIITSSIEHPAVMEVCKYLEKQGFMITILPVDKQGIVSLEELEKAITPSTILVTIMHSNNETGTLQPIKEISRITRDHGILLHTDAAQSIGKISVSTNGIDLLSVAGHKFYAPKGVGALFIRSGVKIDKLIHGADHEQNLRAGTENVLEIAGLGKAAEIAHRDLEWLGSDLKKKRDFLQDKLLKEITGSFINGHPDKRLPNTLNITFPGVEAALLLAEISGKIAISAGAACHTEDQKASAVLTAMGVTEEMARCTLRLSTGRLLTQEDIDFAADTIIEAVKSIKGGLPDKFITGEKIRLTQFTQGLGCACKLRPQALEKVLKEIPVFKAQNVLVDQETSDDAAVYLISKEKAIVQTLDFFTPIVDDPYDFGAIAAANSLSDIYAMGATPLFALNIAAFPSSRLPLFVLEQIFKGASDKAAEAGIPIIGGHTVDDPEPKFGMTVTGEVHPDKILRNSTARPGDALILTKSIGTGILSTALKRGLLKEKDAVELISTMKELNKKAAEIMQRFDVSACTDVTGFGLLGHLYEMTSGSKVDAQINAEKVPLLKFAPEMALAGAVSGGTKNNMEHFGKFVDFSADISEIKKILLFDAQTSGGLLIAIRASSVKELVKALIQDKVNAEVIGSITGNGDGRIIVN